MGKEGFSRALVLSCCLGMMIALGLGVVDGLWNLSSRRFGLLSLRGGAVALIGCMGGVLGGGIGQALVTMTGLTALGLLGWVLLGILIGAAIGFYEILDRWRRKESLHGAFRKVIHGILGGAIGGVLGSSLYMVLRLGLSALLGKPPTDLLSSSGWGLVALGASIGLFIGLAQVILKDAWVRVETGFRSGRELILTKEETTLGRAESCDIGLYGDAGIEKLHARILHQSGRYLLADASSSGGTFLNDQPVTKPTLLRSGDAIRLGNSVLRFDERQKRTR